MSIRVHCLLKNERVGESADVHMCWRTRAILPFYEMQNRSYIVYCYTYIFSFSRYAVIALLSTRYLLYIIIHCNDKQVLVKVT